jgi:3-oxoacyl-[acyl-carrier protein] reductase
LYQHQSEASNEKPANTANQLPTHSRLMTPFQNGCSRYSREKNGATMKTIMIYGAAGGIGSAIGQLFKDKGSAVIAGVRHANGNGLAFADVIVEGDFASEQDAAAMARSVAEEVDQVDMWIYAAGDIHYAKAQHQNGDDWMRMFNANLFGAQRALKASLPLLAADAHIMFVGAYTDRLTLPGLSAYTASKAALAAYSAVIEKELQGKKVSLIRPSAVNTAFWQKVPFKLPANALQPEDVAEKVFNVYTQGLTGLVDL